MSVGELMLLGFRDQVIGIVKVEACFAGIIGRAYQPAQRVIPEKGGR